MRLFKSGPFEFTPSRIKLAENFLSLSSMQVLYYILPLITLPYLIRVLGPEKFGLISFATAFVQYFVLITNYGFNLTTTRHISIHRENIEEISSTFWTVLFLKLCIALSLFILFFMIVHIFKRFSNELPVYLLSYGVVFGAALNPVWLFQGMEEMKEMAFFNFMSRLISLIFIFILIKNASHYTYVPAINAIAFIFIGILSVIYAIFKFKIQFKIPTVPIITRELRNGWNLFISNFAISFYTSSNVVILGFVTNNVYVGYYSAGEKIIRGIQSLLFSYSQAIYPRVSKLASDSRENALRFLKKAYLMFLPIVFISAIGIFIFAPQVNAYILGGKFFQSITIMRLLSFLLIIILSSNFLGIQIMVNFGYGHILRKIILYFSIFHVACAIIAARLYMHIGIALVVLATETGITLTEYIFLHRKGLRLHPLRILN